MDYDASIVAGDVTIGFKRADNGKYGAFWDESGEASVAMGEYDEDALAEPTSPLTVLPNGQRAPEGGKAWIHGDRVFVIAPEDWKAILAKLEIAQNSL